jgi:hypothetical protein
MSLLIRQFTVKVAIYTQNLTHPCTREVLDMRRNRLMGSIKI